MKRISWWIEQNEWHGSSQKILKKESLNLELNLDKALGNNGATLDAWWQTCDKLNSSFSKSRRLASACPLWVICVDGKKRTQLSLKMSTQFALDTFFLAGEFLYSARNEQVIETTMTNRRTAGDPHTATTASVKWMRPPFYRFKLLLRLKNSLP